MQNIPPFGFGGNDGASSLFPFGTFAPPAPDTLAMTLTLARVEKKIDDLAKLVAEIKAAQAQQQQQPAKKQRVASAPASKHDKVEFRVENGKAVLIGRDWRASASLDNATRLVSEVPEAASEIIYKRVGETEKKLARRSVASHVVMPDGDRVNVFVGGFGPDHRVSSVYVALAENLEFVEINEKPLEEQIKALEG